MELSIAIAKMLLFDEDTVLCGWTEGPVYISQEGHDVTSGWGNVGMQNDHVEDQSDHGQTEPS